VFLNIIPQVYYVDPWPSSYATRLQQLIKRPKRIAYFDEHPNATTFRYRVLNPIQTLAACPELGISAAWFDHNDLALHGDFVDAATAIVICRTRYNDRVGNMIARARARNIPILFDCDDLVFDPDRVHLILDSLGIDKVNELVWDDWFASSSRFGTTLRLCDGLITTNAYLGDRAKEFDRRLRIEVMPNYLNREQQELSERLFEIKRQSQWARDDRIHIGYFSGSSTHVRDFAVVAPALCRLLARDQRIVLRVVGTLELGKEFTAYQHKIEKYSVQDFLNLQRVIAETEINVAPLEYNTFTNCKSNLKFFEAAICGTLTLATPTYAFRNSILHRQTGLLVPAHAWDEALAEALSIVENKTYYAKIANAALAYTKKEYGWEMNAASIAKAVFGL
jgi:glycosyltransferase involved in cell wall biosynthesis